MQVHPDLPLTVILEASVDCRLLHGFVGGSRVTSSAWPSGLKRCESSPTCYVQMTDINPTLSRFH